MNDSTRASQNLYSKLSPSDNLPKLIRMNWCLPWSHWGYQRGQDRKLKRSTSRCNVKFRHPKYANSPNEVMSLTVVPPPTSNPKPAFSYTTMSGSANLTWHEPIEISTVISRNVSTHYLLTMKSVLLFKWVSYNLPIKRWCKGAANLDNIPPSFFKSLGPLALQELLSIFNSSFPSCTLSTFRITYHVAIIIPLLKAGKSPTEVASFHLIDLTSCVVKLLEYILPYRLYYIAETKKSVQPISSQILWRFHSLPFALPVLHQ